MARTSKWMLCAALLTLMCACDESDVASVRIRLREDSSGQVTTSNLAQASGDGPMQLATQGVEWQSRVEVMAASGHFSALGALKLADISISSGDVGEGLSFVRVSLPRGENARWPRLFVPLSTDERTRSAMALDPSGKSKDVGSSIKLEIELPAAVVSNGVTGRSRGVKPKVEGSIASLVVPVEVAESAGDPIVWHITWQR